MTIRIAGTDLDDRTFTPEQIAGIKLSYRAFDAEPGIGSFLLPDPLGDTDFKGHREFVYTDTAGTLFDGFVGDQTRTADHPLHPERVHQLTIFDGNQLCFGFRFHAQRPEETVEDRWLWALATYRPQWDVTHVLGTDPVTMPAKAYDSGDGFRDLITDTIELSGKTFYVRSAVDGTREAHMHRFPECTTATLVGSDNPSDWDYVNIFPIRAYPLRTFSPVDLRNEIYMSDQTGRIVVVSDATSIADHNADGMAHDAVLTVEAGSLAELTAKAQQYLTEHKLEIQTYIVEFERLDDAAMAKWRPGELIAITSDTLGLPNSGSPWNIAHADVTPWLDARGVPILGLWNVRMELGAPIRAFRNFTSGVGKPLVPFIPPPPVEPPEWSCIMNVAGGECTDVLPEVHVDVPANHNVSLVYEFEVSGALDNVGWSTGSIRYAIDGGATQTVLVQTRLVSGGGVADNLCWGAGTTGDTSYCSTALLEGAALVQPTAPITAPGGGQPWSLDILGIRHWVQGFGQWDTASTLTVTLLDIIDTTTSASLLEAQVTIPSAPVYGQPTTEELAGDGTTVLFTTNYPYVPGSLVVSVDGLATPVDESDPAAGEFTFADAPASGAVIIVHYLIASSIGTGETNPQPTPSTPPVSSALTVEDEGTPLATAATTLNFVGAGVTASGAGAEKTITIPGGSGVDLGWFNVEDYGAVHDAASTSDAAITAATDDTTAIQDAIDACIAAGGGTVWFPAGIYAVKGALQSTGTYNAQLTIPDVAPGQWVGIRFLGAGPPGPNELQSASVLRSDWNGTISGNPAIISAGTHDSTSPNYVVVTFESITVVAHEDPKLTAIDMTCALGMHWKDLAVNVARADAFTFPVPWDVPTNSNAVGVDMPFGLNSQPFDGGGALYVEGYYTGLRPSEQCSAELVKVAFCTRGIEFRGDQDSPAFRRHMCHITHVASFWNPRSLVFSGDETWVNILALDIEHDDTPFEAVYDIDDASNFGRGFIGWHTTDFTTGPEDNLLVNGATGLSLFGADAKRWKLNSVVHVPTGTDPAANPATGRYVYAASATGNLTVRKPDGSTVDLEGGGAPSGSAGGDLSGTYPNPSVVDDSHNHTAATVSGVAGGIGEILISDTPSTPLVFADLIQNEAQDDLVYADP